MLWGHVFCQKWPTDTFGNFPVSWSYLLNLGVGLLVQLVVCVKTIGDTFGDSLDAVGLCSLQEMTNWHFQFSVQTLHRKYMKGLVKLVWWLEFWAGYFKGVWEAVGVSISILKIMAAFLQPKMNTWTDQLINWPTDCNWWKSDQLTTDQLTN